MKQSYIILRLILLVVCMANVAFAYTFFLRPEQIASIYGIAALDPVHQYLAMTVAALLAVFALGALIAFINPRKYGSIIIMLLLSHFSFFIIDIIVLARGLMNFWTLFAEMTYFLVISTALVRYYPVPVKNAPAVVEAETPAKEEESKGIQRNPEESEEIQNIS